MRDIKITKVLRLTSGKVRLTEAQAKGREHKLEEVKGEKNIYLITDTNEFKVGQEIGYDGPPLKGFADHVEFKDGMGIDGKPSKKEKPKTPGVPIMDIASAIAKLDPDNKKQWTANDVPQVKALEEVLGQDINGDERDAAWQLWQENVDIVEAIELLDPDNAEQWTQDGKPDVKAIQIVLERDITEGQRDLSWELFQKINPQAE